MRSVLRWRALLAFALLLQPDPALGQIGAAPCPVAIRLSPLRPEARCLESRRGLLPPAEWTEPDGVLSLLPVDLTGSYRSGFPEDRANGRLWAGRGASAGTSAGVVVRLGHLTVAVAPEAVWAENRDVSLPGPARDGFSPYANPWSVTDQYVRPGAERRFEVGPGASFAEVRFGQARAGVSTEPLWWGAGRRHSLLFSATASGFPHAYVEADDVATPAGGTLSLRTLWGRLDESDWYDADARNDHRLIGAAQAAWRPGFVPGLELALSLVRHEPLPGGSLEAAQLFQLFTGDPSGEVASRRGASMGSLSFRVAVPETGMEVYGEVGRGDAFVNGDPGVSDTRYAQIYMMGFSRTDTTSSGSAWRVSGEVIKQALEIPQPGRTGPEVPAAFVRQGHTHQGQLLGDWIGPGSNAQIVSFDWLGESVPWGLFAERVRRDDDTYYRVHGNAYGFRGHDLEWTLGARAAHALATGGGGTVRVHAESGVSRRKNRSFIGLDGGANWTWLREWNLWTDLSLRWYPGR